MGHMDTFDFLLRQLSQATVTRLRLGMGSSALSGIVECGRIVKQISTAAGSRAHKGE